MVIEDMGVDVIPREEAQSVTVRNCGSWGEKHRIETECMPFQTLLLSIFLYILYVKLDDTVTKFLEPDLKFF